MRKQTITNRWRLFSENDTTITFQNTGSWPIYVIDTTSAVTPNDKAVSFAYYSFDGEVEKTVSNFLRGGSYLWARTIANKSVTLITSGTVEDPWSVEFSEEFG